MRIRSRRWFHPAASLLVKRLPLYGASGRCRHRKSRRQITTGILCTHSLHPAFSRRDPTESHTASVDEPLTDMAVAADASRPFEAHVRAARFPTCVFADLRRSVKRRAVSVPGAGLDDRGEWVRMRRLQPTQVCCAVSASRLREASVFVSAPFWGVKTGPIFRTTGCAHAFRSEKHAKVGRGCAGNPTCVCGGVLRAVRAQNPRFEKSKRGKFERDFFARG